MSISLFLFSSIITSLVSQAIAFHWTYPACGNHDYAFRAGDRAILQWTPNVLLQEIYLIWGPASDMEESGTTIVGVQVGNAFPGVQYDIQLIPEEPHHTYCSFCTKEEQELGSGTFRLHPSRPDTPPRTWGVEYATSVASSMLSSGSREKASKTHTQTKTATTEKHNPAKTPDGSAGLYMPTGSSGPDITTTILGYYLNTTISTANVYPTATGSQTSSFMVPVASGISTSPQRLTSNRIVSSTVPLFSVSVHLRIVSLGLAVIAIIALVL